MNYKAVKLGPPEYFKIVGMDHFDLVILLHHHDIINYLGRIQ